MVNYCKNTVKIRCVTVFVLKQIAVATVADNTVFSC